MTKRQRHKQKARRGFAAMTLEQRKAIASKGGKAAHKTGKAHEFTTEEAKVAGKKGGLAAQAAGTSHRWTSKTAKAAVRKRIKKAKAKDS